MKANKNQTKLNKIIAEQIELDLEYLRKFQLRNQIMGKW